jgi:hypothetical protein
MSSKQIQKDSSISFWSLFHKYRIKIALLSFFVIIPLTLILVAYLGPLNDSKQVTFDQTITGTSEFISSFKNLDDIKDLDITLKWTELNLPILNDKEERINGSYTFNFSYTVLDNKNISGVTIQVALKSLYGNVQNVSNPVSISSSVNGTNITVSHNILYPFSPLWFVTINEPIVYLKITYKETIPGISQPLDVIQYASYSLANVLPKKVT